MDKVNEFYKLNDMQIKKLEIEISPDDEVLLAIPVAICSSDAAIYKVIPGGLRKLKEISVVEALKLYQLSLG